WGGVHGQYVLIYFDARRPRFRTITVPPSMRARIDVIDTWNMTIEELPGVHTGDVRIELPARPYMAVRLRHTVSTWRTAEFSFTSNRDVPNPYTDAERGMTSVPAWPEPFPSSSPANGT
ncbi:MAG TPA: DUF5605 domain-containing protein, partial [Actinoplanes sp.]|nr:DUF5605 domain-containing protein [Actinoplanes sp.]